MVARLTAEQWEQARAEYEVRGVSLRQVSDAFGVDRAAVSRRAKREGWKQGKSHGVVEKKVSAIKALAEANAESHALPVTFQHTVESVVRERLQAEGLLAQLDSALAGKAIELAQKATKPEDVETLSRARRNMAPAREAQPQTTVNVTQQQAQAMPLSPRDALNEMLHGEILKQEVDGVEVVQSPHA